MYKQNNNTCLSAVMSLALHLPFLMMTHCDTKVCSKPSLYEDFDNQIPSNNLFVSLI